MENENANRSRRVIFRLTQDEYVLIQKRFEQSTCRKLSEYIRNCALGKPIVKTIRNRSMDDMMEELIRLRNQLNPLGNNLNQAVKRLHMLTTYHELKSWQIGFEMQRKILTNKIEQIKNSIQKIAELWLQ
ncbi:plasmid mobilization relaxosome protein MobC [Sphingobacterium corticis]|uniref:Plasmid mobilization relaxosome protein MobC n=1 Tax=Sphingobacterium corticis TaxID=1812823 RepID=A0ABW5NJ19_9SPHI